MIENIKKEIKKKVVSKKQLKSFKKKDEGIFNDLSVNLKIEDRDNEMNINFSWKNVSKTDSEYAFSKINSLMLLFRKFNKKYGEDEVKIIAEADDGKTEVKVKMGDCRMEFVLNTIKDEEVFLEISKRISIDKNKLKKIVELEEDD